MGDFWRDQLPVGEDLEVAVGMPLQQVEQVGMQEGLATKQAEEGVAVRFGIANDAVELAQGHHLPRRLHVHPAPLAAEVAGVDHGEMQEWREDHAFFSACLEAFDREHSLEAKVPAKLPEAVGGNRGRHAVGKLRQNHGRGAFRRMAAQERSVSRWVGTGLPGRKCSR